MAFQGNMYHLLFFLGLLLTWLIRYPHLKKINKKQIQALSPIHRFLTFTSILGMQVLPLLYLLTPWLIFADYHLPAWANPLGLIAFILGIVLLWRSHFDLGVNLSVKVGFDQNNFLVTHGIYQYLRHPMYASFLFWGIAQALMLQNWIAGPLNLVSFLASYFLCIKEEEAALIQNFGDEYLAYMRKTGRLLPRLFPLRHKP